MNNRAMDYSKVQDMDKAAAWEMLKLNDEAKDMFGLKEVRAALTTVLWFSGSLNVVTRQSKSTRRQTAMLHTKNSKRNSAKQASILTLLDW